MEGNQYSVVDIEDPSDEIFKKMYQCSLCSITCATAQSVRRHLRRCHNSEQPHKSQILPILQAKDDFDSINKTKSGMRNSQNYNGTELNPLTGNFLKKATFHRRNQNVEKFKNWMAENKGVCFDDLLTNPTDLELAVVTFLNEFTIFDRKTQQQLRPKVAYLDAVRSHLKNELNALTGFDLGNRARFPVFANSISGIKKQLKQDGRHKTNHYEEIPNDTLEVIVKIRLEPSISYVVSGVAPKTIFYIDPT